MDFIAGDEVAAMAANTGGAGAGQFGMIFIAVGSEIIFDSRMTGQAGTAAGRICLGNTVGRLQGAVAIGVMAVKTAVMFQVVAGVDHYIENRTGSTLGAAMAVITLGGKRYLGAVT